MKASEVRILTENSMECHPRGFQTLLFTADFFWMERVTDTHLLRRKNPSVLYLPKLPMVARFVRDLSLFPEILKNPWLYVRDLLHVPSSSPLVIWTKKSIRTSETICNDTKILNQKSIFQNYFPKKKSTYSYLLERSLIRQQQLRCLRLVSKSYCIKKVFRAQKYSIKGRALRNWCTKVVRQNRCDLNCFNQHAKHSLSLHFNRRTKKYHVK